MAYFFLILALILRVAMAINLFVAGTSRHLSSLSLSVSSNGSATLSQIASSAECGPVPAWLTFDAQTRILYCLDDTTTGSAAVHAFSAGKDGKLTHVSAITTSVGPVSSTLYSGAGGKMLAVAF
jgi:hypothetical protein